MFDSFLRPLKLMVALALLSAAMNPDCHAILGDSLEQCEKKYGPLAPSDDQASYMGVDGELVVTLGFRGGVCRSIAYLHSVRARGLPPTQISEAQRKDLLQRNFGGNPYTTEKLSAGNVVQYRSQDGRFVATYDVTKAELTVTDNAERTE